MTILDLSDYETLPLYDVIQNLSIETGKPIGLWLFRIAQAVCTKNEPLNDSNIVHLMLRPDDRWKVLTGYKKIEKKPRNVDSWMDTRFGGLRERTEHRFNDLSANVTVEAGDRDGNEVAVFDFWVVEHSVLTSFLSKNVSPPIKEECWKGMNNNLKKEGVVLHRSDFREWCRNSSYDLPRFWYTDKDRQESTELTPHLESPAGLSENLAATTRLNAVIYVKEQTSEASNKIIIKKLETYYGLEGSKLFDVLAEGGRVPLNKITRANSPDQKKPSRYKRGVVFRMKNK